MTTRTDDARTMEGSVKAPERVDGLCGPVSFGDLVSAFRICDEMSQAQFAHMLDVSESYVSVVENGEQILSPETAAAWAATIGYPGTVFVERALQDQLDRAGLKMTVHVEAMETEDFD